MTHYSLLALYCFLVLLASLAGGLIPLLIRLNHRRMQLAISLVAGFMLGVALLHLLPHAMMAIPAYTAVRWLVVGLMAMFFLERFFCFHHHDAPDENPPAGAEAVTDGPACPACDQEPSGPAHGHEHRLGWGGAAVGLSIHSLIAGAALAACIHTEAGGDGIHVGWPGLAVFLVILLHKPFDSLTLGTLMAAGGWSVPMRHLVNALFALAVPLGAVLFYLGLASVDIESSQVVGAAVAFSAGVFLVISLSDLLPELQFHHHDRASLSAALLLGVALAWTVSHIEARSHAHEQSPTSTSIQADDPAKAPGPDDHAGHAH